MSLLWRAAGQLGVSPEAAAAGRGGGTDRLRRPDPLPPPIGALRDLPFRRARRPADGAPGPRRGHRSGHRSRPPGLARGPRRHRPRRRRCARTGTVGRPGPGPGRTRRRRRLPRTGGRPDAGPRPATRPGPDRGPGHASGRRPRVRPRAAPDGHVRTALGPRRRPRRSAAAQIAFAVNRGSEAPPLLLKAARQLERLDPALARDTYLEALSAAMFAGRLAVGVTARDVAEAARSAPQAPGRRDQPICCWTGWRSGSPTATQQRSSATAGGRGLLRRRSIAGGRDPVAVAGLHHAPPKCGTTRVGTRSPPVT